MTGDRTVRRLVLTASSDAAVRRGALLVEDALRTASLPGADGGRRYVVRRLSLGTIDPTRPPATVALAIERRFAALRAQAVHVDAPSAPTAAAVYFHDDVEPFTALVRRVAAGRRAGEWFWPLAVRGYRADLAPARALRIALACALATRPGPAAVVALLASLDDAALDAVCAILEPADADALLAPMSWPEVAASPIHLPSAAGAREPIDVAVAPRWTPRLARWVQRWGPTDRRAAWLALVALCDGAPARLSIARTGRDVVRILAALAAMQGGQPSRPEPPAARRADPAAAEEAASTSTASDLDVRDPDESRAPVADDEPAADGEPRRTPWSGVPVPTAAGGLLFLLRPLARLGIARWLEASSAPGHFAAELLGHVARRAGVAADDPLLSALAPPDPAPPSPQVVDDVVAWRAAIVRWSRRRTRRPLASLVRRPARVVATRTHIDVIFPLGHVDATIRRLGLDLDPGWVPWLGRIVQFHYLEDELGRTS